MASSATKIPCDYSWAIEYSEPSEVEVSRDGDLGVLTIYGSGDGTLDILFTRNDWRKLAEAICDVEWDLFPELQENPEEG